MIVKELSWDWLYNASRLLCRSYFFWFKCCRALCHFLITCNFACFHCNNIFLKNRVPVEVKACSFHWRRFASGCRGWVLETQTLEAVPGLPVDHRFLNFGEATDFVILHEFLLAIQMACDKPDPNHFLFWGFLV